MNWDQIEGQWKNIKGNMREKWAKLTDDDLEMIGGQKDKIIGKLQERYGMAKEKAEDELNNYIAAMDKDKEKDRSKSSLS